MEKGFLLKLKAFSSLIKEFRAVMFVMHPPSVPASVRPNKNIWSKKQFCALCPDSVGDPCQPGSSQEEKPSILGVAVMTIAIGDPRSKANTHFSRFGMNSLIYQSYLADSP